MAILFSLLKKEWLEATKSGDLARIQSLIDAGVNINALDHHGQTALMNSAMHGKYEVARLLVQQGAEFNHTAKYHLTALMLAVINRHKEIVQLLAEAGADTGIKGSHGQFACTPLEYADRSAMHEISAVLRAHARQPVEK